MSPIRIPELLPSCALALLLAACGAPRPAVGPGAAGTPDRAAAGKRAPGQEGVPLLAWRAFGTEPFWSVRVQGDTLRFTRPGEQAGRRLTGTHVLRADGIRYFGDDGGTTFELDLRRGECSDGMSDLVHAFEATFRHGDAYYRGCAEQAK